MKRLAGKVMDFFFAPESPRPLAAVRICGGLALLLEAARHWLDAVELYSTAGPALPMFSSKIVGLLVPGPWGAAALASLHLASLVTFTLGWKTRTSATLALFLSLWLWPLDAAATFTKYSVLGIHLLALLTCSGAGEAWSVDQRGDSRERFVAPWPRRLLQFLLCSVYLGASLTKLKVPGFANGDLLTFSLLDEHWGGGASGWALGQRLVLHPTSVLVLSQITLLIELTFPFLVWVRSCRRTVLLAAFALHAGMGLLMHLGIFSGIMAALLLSFLEESDFQAIHACWRKFRRRTDPADSTASASAVSRRGEPAVAGRLWSWAGVVTTWTVIAGIGTLILWRHDASEVFGNRSLTPLREIPRAEAELRLVDQMPALEDYFFRIELGSRVSGNQTFGLTDRFPLGNTVHALVQLVPGHEKLAIEGVLLDPDGREARRTVDLSSSSHMAVLSYPLIDSSRAGEYRLVIQAEGVDVWQKRFTVVAE